MNQNVRFYALVGAVLVIVGGMIYFVRGRDNSGPSTPDPTALKPSMDEPRETVQAPDIAPARPEGRFAPAASRASAPREMTASKKVGNYAISGQVVLQEDESPVEGAEVSVYWVGKDAAIQTYDDENVWRTRTNVKGFYRVPNLPASDYVVIATKRDLSGVSGASINPREPEDNIVNLSLRQAGTIAGRVTNEKREPVPNALIALGQGKRGERDLYGGDTQTKSGADGAFTLEYVDEGTWSLSAKAEGYGVGSVSDIATNSANVEIALKPGGSASGVVVSAETSQPVPNVSLVLGSAGRYDRLNNQKTTTDGEGTFAFKDLADGEYRLALDKSPYIATGQPPSIAIANANALTDLKINVIMGGSISGRATDAVTGAPIKGMAFRAQGNAGGAAPAETDDDGVYKIEGLQAGQYIVRRMWMAGYRHGEDREDRSVTVALGQEVTGIDFAVPPGLTMRGRVVDKGGEPLGMVDVTSVDANNSEGESMVTDEKGRWVHRGFSQGTVVTITASKAGYSAPPMENVTIPDHDLDGIEIVMDTGASIEGTVVDQKGEPVSDVLYVTAIATKPSAAGQRQQMGWSRDDGTFKVQGLEEGTYRLEARSPRSWGPSKPTGKEVPVRKGERVTGVKVVIDFDAGTKIAGRVVDSSGKPIKGVNVSAYMPNGGGGGDDSTDDDGAFEIGGLQSGSYWVNAYHSNYTSYRQEAVEAPNPNLNITLRGNGKVQGRVLEAGSGRPIRSFTIAVVQGASAVFEPGNSWNGNGKPFVADDGAFEIEVPDGGATLLVQAQGYAPNSVSIADTKEGTTKSGVEIRLNAGGAIEGTVANKNGERIAGARIYIGRAPMGDWERRERPAMATTDADGTFRLDSLPAQEVRLYALHEQYASASAIATPSAGGAPARVQIVMGGGGTVKGVVRVDGKPTSGYGVSVWAHDGGYQSNVNVGGDGSYRFSGLPDGAVSLSVYSTQGGSNRNISKQAEIVADQTVTVDFDIASGNAALEGTVTRGGQAVSGAWVSISIRTGDDTNEGSGTQTGANGSFRFDGLPPGTANVMVHENVGTPSLQQARNFRVELVNDETARLDADLNSGARVTGKIAGMPQGWIASVMLVTGAVDIPEGVSLQEMHQDFSDRVVGGAQAQGDGSFTLEGVQPGDYTAVIVAFDPQSGGQTHKHATAAVTVPESGEATVNVQLP